MSLDIFVGRNFLNRRINRTLFSIIGVCAPANAQIKIHSPACLFSQYTHILLLRDAISLCAYSEKGLALCKNAHVWESAQNYSERKHQHRTERKSRQNRGDTTVGSRLALSHYNRRGLILYYIEKHQRRLLFGQS